MSASGTFAMPSRAHAAMCVAECHAMSFGVQHDRKQAVQWVHTASELGSVKAAAWYPRLCTIDNVLPAENSSIMGFEANLSHITSDAYLSNRVHLQIRIAIQQIKSTILNWDQLHAWDSFAYISSIRVFNSWEQDDLPPLHAAALLGEDEAISKLLCHAKGDELSSRGLTTAHYACIGGHLSTLQLLLNHSAPNKAAYAGGITLLHLCIFFAGDDVGNAVSLILGIGDDPRATVIQPVEWEYHDIRLAGTPLDWAVRIRHKSLVVSLLPFAQDDSCLKLAIRSFFWEIAEVILQYSRGAENIPIKSPQQLSDLSVEDQYLLTVERPFGHWLAHGPDHLVALERTVQVCRDHHLMASGSASHLALTDIVNLASFEDDFSLIISCVASLSPGDVKRRNEKGESALEQALGTSEDTQAWRMPLEAITSMYTIEELEGIGSTSVDDFSYLHLAISSDSLIGTRTLLQKGVDVNQRSSGLLGETPLLMSANSKFSKEFHSLLLDYGAKDDVVDDFTGTNLLVLGLMRSQPNEDLLRGVLRNEDLSNIGDALHFTLGYFISGYSLRGAIAEMFKRDNAVENGPGTSTIKLDKDELNILWDNLRDISQRKKWELKLILGKEQLDSLLRLEGLDSAQRPASLDLVVNVGEMKYILGEEEAQHILGQGNAEPTGVSSQSQLAETEDGNSDASDPDDYTNTEKPDQYWKELFKMQLGLPNWVTYINERNSSGMTLLHSAAYYLHPESIALLLEAGADASIGFAEEGHNAVLPLQIACSAGRICEWARVQGTYSAIASLGKHSMDVASELLHWHHTRSDRLFQGVTKLHLAYRMMLRDVVDELCRDGHSADVEAHWPGIDTPVTCDDLAAQLADDDRFIDISDLITAEYPMIKAQS
jgi:ankyrin repeat protein